MRRNTIYPYKDVQKHYLPDGVTSDDDHHDVDADSGKYHLPFPQSPLQQWERKEITQCNFVEVKNNWAKSVWLAADHLWTLLYV